MTEPDPFAADLIDETDPFTPAPVVAIKLDTLDGLVTAARVTVKLNGDLFGMPYSSIDQSVDFAFENPTDDPDDALAKLTAHLVTTTLQAGLLAASGVISQGALPTPARGRAAEGQLGAGAGYAGPATGSAREQAGQVLNGASPSTDELQEVTGEYGPLYVRSTKSHPKAVFEAQAKAMFAEQADVQVEYLSAYSNVEDLLLGKRNPFGKLPGHAGRVVLSRNAPAAIKEVIGKKSVGWVDYDLATGGLSIKPTKDFTGLRDGERKLLAEEGNGDTSQTSTGGAGRF